MVTGRGLLLGGGVVELILSRAKEAALHSRVGPESPDDPAQLSCHETLLRRAGQDEKLTGIILGSGHGKKGG